MDHDDDVEHLFSWLQTPELRYREFAGAREIVDTVIIMQARPNPAQTPAAPAGNVQVTEQYPVDQFPDQRDAREDVPRRAPPAPRPIEAMAPPPAAAAPIPSRPAAPATIAPAAPMPTTDAAGVFGLGVGGRNTLRRPHYEEPVVPPPPVIQTPPPPRPSVAPPTPAPPGPAATAAPSAPAVRPGAGGGLLGGAYRGGEMNGHGAEAGATPPAAAESQQTGQRSLDAVFGRLARARDRLPDPRERLRHIPGLGPPPNRSR